MSHPDESRTNLKLMVATVGSMPSGGPEVWDPRRSRSWLITVPVRDDTMAAQLDRTIALDRMLALLTALFGFLAVALATIGLYGVMAFTVAARTREIGIRMALGADRARVLRQVIGESAVLVLMGIAIGCRELCGRREPSGPSCMG